MKEPMAKAFSSLEELFNEKAMKKVGGKMLDISPFDIATMLIGSFPFRKSFFFVSLLSHIIRNAG